MVVEAGQKASADVYDWAVAFNGKQRTLWTDSGGEIVGLSKEAHDELMKIMRPIGAEVVSSKPSEKALFDLLVKTAQTTA